MLNPAIIELQNVSIVGEGETIPEPKINSNGPPETLKQEFTQGPNISISDEIIFEHIVHINDKSANYPSGIKSFFFPPFAANRIQTTKYTWWNFIPKNLLEQLLRLSNIYFILVMIFALIPGVSPVFPITSILPVAFIFGTTMIKDGFEDLIRYLGDRKLNTAKFHCIRGGLEVLVASSDLLVGDIVRIEDDTQFPCDLMLLSSSKDTGLCFVSTINLNGESNLKLHSSPETTRSLDNAEKLTMLTGKVSCEKPRFELEILNARVQFNSETEAVLTNKNVLLRGAVLKNTDWVFGLILFTGKQTKLSLNAKKPKFKLSLLDKKLNKFMIFILLLHLVIDASMVVAYVLLQANYSLQAFYLYGYKETPNFLFVLYACFTVFILNNLLIPMSLFVSLEFIKAFQAKFMNWDVKMSHGDKRMYPNTSNLNEDLSQIEYIFTDKTGTLTENQMEFNKCVVGKDILHDERLNPGGLKQMFGQSPDGSTLDDQTLSQLKLFLLSLSLCHTINPEFNTKLNDIEYDGSSIDEVALVYAGKANGFILESRTSNEVTISVLGEKQTWKILETIEFNSDRKRMTVVLRSPKDEILVLTKGADTIISKRLRPDDPILEHVIVTCNSYAQLGLRTLFFSYKEMTEDAYQIWSAKYRDALSSSMDKNRKIEAACHELESELTLIGASAIEDLLQDEVPETIEFFRRAGVQVWILTGDTRVTACSIGRSSRLLTNDTIEAHIHGSSKQQVAKDLLNCIEMQQYNRDVSIILDTDSLRIAVAEYKPLLLEAIKGVSSAICCRVTPLQKALVARLVQKHFKKIGLGIGDGANDVSLISEANIGVGIMGREGSQAARSADYAIPKFRHLKRLVAVHGRLSLVRNAYFIQYSFYKNMNLTFVSGFFNAFCLFSSTSILDSWFLTLYNMIFNILFPIGIATFERDFSEKDIEKNPALYQEIRRGFGYRINYFTFGGWVFQALYHSVIIFFFAYAASQDSFLENTIDDIYVMSLFIGMAVHMVNLKKAILEVREMNILIFLAFLISYILFFGWMLFYSAFPIFELDGHSSNYTLFYVVLATSRFWIYLVLAVVTCLIPDILYKVIRNHYWKDPMIEINDNYVPPPDPVKPVKK